MELVHDTGLAWAGLGAAGRWRAGGHGTAGQGEPAGRDGAAPLGPGLG